MRSKRFITIATLLCVALATAGIAFAKVKSGGVIGVSATFNAPTIARSVAKSCTVNGGDTYTYTRAVYKGTAVSADPRLNGAIKIWAQSMVDDTTGIGAVIGDYKIRPDAKVPGAFGRIEASLASGQMSGAVRGHAPKPWGELFAGLNGGFDASAGFSNANVGTGSGAASGVLLQHGACVRTIYLH